MTALFCVLPILTEAALRLYLWMIVCLARHGGVELKIRVALFVLCMAADAVSKAVAVLHGWSVRNTGAAFSLASGSVLPPWAFSAFGACAVAAVAAFAPRTRSSVGIVIMAAGIAGNLIDRIVYGYVTDWLKIYFVSCNLADLFICAGGGLMLISAMLYCEGTSKG